MKKQKNDPAASSRTGPGMKRRNYYATAEAIDGVERAIERVRTIVGTKVPRHKVLSALWKVCEDHTDDAAAILIRQLAADVQSKQKDTPT